MLGVGIMFLRQKYPGARFIDLGNAAGVFEIDEDLTRSIKMFHRIRVPFELQLNETNVVFNARQVTRVSSLLKMNAGGGIFNQSAIKILAASHSFEDKS